MLNYDNFAITLGRAVNVFRTSPEDVVQHKGALRALVALSSLGSVALRVEDGAIRIGGKAVPGTLPFVSDLLANMEKHRVQRLNISRGAAAIDLLKMVRALAADDRTVLEDQYGTIGVDVIALISERLSLAGRPASVTRAFDQAAIEEAIAAAGDGPDPVAEIEEPVPVEEVDSERTVEIEPPALVADDDPQRTLEIEPQVVAAAEDPERTLEIERESVVVDPADAVDEGSPTKETATLSMAMLRLAGAGEGDDVEALVFVVVAETEKELEAGNDAMALEGIASLVNLESHVPQTEKSMYTQALLRLLVPETLVRVARLVAESRHARYAVAVLHRAGSVGREALFEQLVKAPSVEETDAYGAALPAVEGGVEKLVESLKSKDSAIVSIAVDQLSKLNVTEVAASLGTLAIDHPQRLIRQDACRGLIRMQSDEGVLDQVRRILDSKTVVLFGRCIEEGASDPLVGLISLAVNSTDDLVARKELCRALGRARSTRAIQQLIKMSLPGGRFFGRKPLDTRLAAIEGLGLINTPVARGTLEELAADRNAQIRNAAKKRLEQPDSTLSG